MISYTLGKLNDVPFITCLRCDRVSFNKNDIEKKYCPNCRYFHDQITSFMFDHFHPFWILVNKIPTPEKDMFVYFNWLETKDRIIGQTQIGNAFISTVFVGIGNHHFETMIFGGEFGGKQQMYPTWEAAETGHSDWVHKVEFVSCN